MKTIKVGEIVSQAKYWAEEAQDDRYSRRLQKHYTDKAMAIVALLTNIELDRTIDFDSTNIEQFYKTFDNLYEKYKKEIFG